MRLTVLGKSPSWQDVDGACSGYLIEHDGTRLLLDCGSGVFAKLRRVCEFVDIDAVVISHLHADHVLDLVPYGYALLHSLRRQTQPQAAGPDNERPARPRLYGPPGAAQMFRRLVGSWGSEDLIESAFDLHEYQPDEELEVGGIRLRFQEVPHYTVTYAVELTAADCGRLTYGADCSPNEELVEFARGTDLLLLEATLPEPEDEGDRGHLTPVEAGEHGRAAGAHRLVVTHFPDELDPEWVHSEAARGFGGEVELAREGASYTI